MSQTSCQSLEGIANIALDMNEEMIGPDHDTGPTPSRSSSFRAKSELNRLSTISLPNKFAYHNISTSHLSLSSSSSMSSSDSGKIAPLLRYSNSVRTYANQSNISFEQYCKNNNEPSIASSRVDSSNSHYLKQSRCIDITRDVLDLDTFGHKAGCQLYEEPETTNSCPSIHKCAQSLCGECSPYSCLASVFPIIEWLPKYSVKSNLMADIIAGITISILHIPQGIAYSLLAGLGPVNGLYVSFFPVLVYVLMGTSPHISIGTFAIASIMLNNIATKVGAGYKPPSDLYTAPTLTTPSTIMSTTVFAPDVNGSVIEPSLLNTAVPPTTLEVVTSVCLLCGFIQIAMGLLRLGSLSLILSEHLVSAFSTAIAFHVATSQFTYIFGFENLPRAKNGPLKLIKSWSVMVEHYKEINYNSLIFSLILISILVLFKECIEPRLKKRNVFPIPIDLLLVVFSILMSWLFKFNRNFSIQVVKEVPTGLPKPTVPRIDLMADVFVDSVILSVICFAVSLSLAKIFAKKHNYQVRANQELLALGSANLFSSFFLAYPCSAALSRSTLQEKVGGKTQIAGLVSSFIILTVLLLLAPYLYHLPKCTLSCIILVALKSMFMQIGDLSMFWRISKLDGMAWIITFSSVIFLDIDLGLIIGISVSIIVLLIRFAMPKISTLGQLATTEIYAETNGYRNLDIYPDTKIVRFGSALFYLNVDTFKEKVLSSFKNNTSDSKPTEQSLSLDKAKTLILDLCGMSFIDKAGIDALVEVIQTLQSQKVSTSLVMCPYHILQCLERVHFADRVKHAHCPCKIYPTIHDAVIDSL